MIYRGSHQPSPLECLSKTLLLPMAWRCRSSDSSPAHAFRSIPMNARNSYTFLKANSYWGSNICVEDGRVWLVQDLCIPTFIPKQVVYLYSSIAHYERCF